MQRTRLLLLVGLLGLHPALANDQPAKKPPPAPTNIVVTLASDKATYRRGETVHFTITARNAGKTPQKLVFASGQQFDLTATLAGQKQGQQTATVWKWSHGRMFTMIYTEKTLAPGETLRWTAEWNQTGDDEKPVPRGRYSVQAEAPPGGILSKPLLLTLAD
jgi:Intracellular proteinase inhibitor